MVQNLLIQASLSDIEAVVRKVLDDRLNDLIPQRKEDTPLYLTRDEAAKMLRKTCPLCYFRYREYFKRKEGRT